MRSYFSFVQYHKAQKAGEQFFEFTEPSAFQAADVARTQTIQPDGALQTRLVFTMRKNVPGTCGFRLVFEEPDWCAENYVFAPAALYAGNRFQSVAAPYPPVLSEEQRLAYRDEPVISDVPRLEKNGDGCVQLCAGDLSAPCIGFYSPKQQQGWLLFFEQKNECGDFGITVCEEGAGKRARFLLSSPCVREGKAYRMCTTKAVSNDRGARLQAGDTVTFSFREYTFACQSACGLLNRFFALRTGQALPRTNPHGLPWSYANVLIEEKYNARNWLEKPGFYRSSEAVSSIYRQWQTGWVGGAINTLPGLVTGGSLTQRRSMKTLDFVFEKLQHPSGFLYGIYCGDKRYGDDFSHPEHANIVMIRKNSDALYYLAKQLLFLRKTGEIKPVWEKGLQRLADAFVTFYRKNGTLGQLIDMESFDLFLGGSSAAAIAPAGLALCGLYFNKPEYVRIAAEIAQGFHTDYVERGYTNGGPGEILACPDSESAFGLLESFVVLHAVSGEDCWVKFAVDTASLCSSWCVAYDYAYENNTQLSRRGVSTTGAVWASVQNKHAAPGICTLSGSSLFRLFRATGEVKYLELCRDIAHNLTQFVSTRENPVYQSYVWHDGAARFQKWLRTQTVRCARFVSSRHLPAFGAGKTLFNPPGRINERVNLSDWEGKNNVGEVPLGSCWPEVSALLTYLEIPAAYLQKDTGFCFAFDHVECKLAEKMDSGFVFAITNPTGYDATYRLYVETSTACATPIQDMALCTFQTITVCAHQTARIRMEG